jgi:hypothetical protein
LHQQASAGVETNRFMQRKYFLKLGGFGTSFVSAQEYSTTDLKLEER